MRYQRWETGILENESESDDDLFVNEWLARFGLSDTLFISYGRENLQWGPSYLLSPSNPFNQDNGRDNPYLEVPGMDYVRLVWIPSTAWSASLMVNTDEGRVDFSTSLARQREAFSRMGPEEQSDLIRLVQPLLSNSDEINRYLNREFETTYAAKIDYTGYEKYGSLVSSHREGDGEYLVGAYGGMTVSDAALFYAEGRIEFDGEGDKLLVGASYTFQRGSTATIEYYHNAGGCSTEPIEACFLRGSADPTDFLIRRNYLLAQYVDTRIMGNFNLVVRWVWNLDDYSSQAVNIFEYEVGDHIHLFFVGDGFTGGSDTEFGSLVNYSLMTGIQYAF
jgi:hypothetical protein